VAGDRAGTRQAWEVFKINSLCSYAVDSPAPLMMSMSSTNPGRIKKVLAWPSSTFIVLAGESRIYHVNAIDDNFSAEPKAIVLYDPGNHEDQPTQSELQAKIFDLTTIHHDGLYYLIVLARNGMHYVFEKLESHQLSRKTEYEAMAHPSPGNPEFGLLSSHFETHASLIAHDLVIREWKPTSECSDCGVDTISSFFRLWPPNEPLGYKKNCRKAFLWVSSYRYAKHA